MRTITVVNHTTMATPEQVGAAVAAVALQLADQFCPAFGLAAIGLELGDDHGQEAIILADDSDQANALGYHEEIADVPRGFVFVKTTMDAGDRWEATLSHEVLEQAADPFVQMITLGRIHGRVAGVAYEVCDPVENDEYDINGTPVSNFVLPAWFVGEQNAHVDFLGKLTTPFTMSPGGYIAFTNNLRGWQQIFGETTPDHQRRPAKYSRRSRRVARHAIS